MSTARTKQAVRRRRPRFGPGSAGMLMTPEQFDATPPSEWVKHYRYELLHGVLVVSPPPGAGERDPNDELGYLLRAYGENHPQGATLDATLPEQTLPFGAERRRADRTVWAGLGRIPDTERDVPTILIEFVSKRRRDALRDYEQKRDEYLAAGVKESWVIDRFRRIMTVYRQGNVGPTHEIISETQSYETALLPGFALPLARLLSRADQWKKTRPRTPPPAEGNIPHG